MCKANDAVLGYAKPKQNIGRIRLDSGYKASCDIMKGLTYASDSATLYGIITFTYFMPTDPQAKRKVLQTTGTFNPRAALVRHPLFEQSSFFDPQDLLQLKYETLRAIQADHSSIAKAAREFGLSRPTIYEAQTQFQQQGLQGLLPRKRGPKAAHKLTDELLQYLQEQATAEPQAKTEELARRVRQRYAVKLHPRTIEKALKAKAKRGRLI
jgi:transposase